MTAIFRKPEKATSAVPEVYRRAMASLSAARRYKHRGGQMMVTIVMPAALADELLDALSRDLLAADIAA